MFLTDTQLQDLTGLRQGKAQIRWLQRNGVKHFVRADGRPVVVRGQELSARPVSAPILSETPRLTPAQYVARRRAQQHEPIRVKPRRKPPAPKGTQIQQQTHMPLKDSAASSRRRKALIRQSTPAWANKIAIAAVYAQAARLKRLTGVEHHVDHIVQLCGGTVCGLHVEHNLRVIPFWENLRRPRAFVP